MRDPLKPRFDQALFNAITRNWDKTKIDGYPQTFESHAAATSGTATETFQMIDAKAAGMLTHVSMMIAGLGISAPLLAQHRVEEAVIVFEICVYLLIALGCLRCLSVLGPLDAPGEAADAQLRVNRELIIRQELYRFCNRFTIRFTVLVFISLPIMLWWHPVR